jgi:hypothetical protein
MVLPRKTQRDTPVTITILILPCDVFGTTMDTADASVEADTCDPRRNETGRTSGFFVDLFCVCEVVTTVAGVGVESSAACCGTDDGEIVVPAVTRGGTVVARVAGLTDGLGVGVVGASVVVVGTTLRTPTVVAEGCGCSPLLIPTCP